MHGATSRVDSSVAVVIPAYNEEARIDATVRTVIHYLTNQSWVWELIVVDDGSLDRTSDKARVAASGDTRVKIVRFETNHGKGWALRKGFRLSQGDHVLFCDADLSTPIDELAGFLEKAREGYDLIVADRFSEQAHILIPQGLLRRLAGRAFRTAVASLRLKTRDTQCGFKLLRRTPLEPIIEATKTDRFAFDVELLLRAQLAGLRLADQPVSWSNSTGTQFSLLRDGFASLADLVRIRRMAKSLRKIGSASSRRPL